MKGLRLEIFFLLLFRRIGTAFKEGEASKDEFERFRGFFLRERRGGNYDWFNLKFRRRGQEKGVIKCRYNSM